MPTNSIRGTSWTSFAAEVALLPIPTVKAGSASVRNRFRSASAATPPRTPSSAALAASPRPRSQTLPKSALKESLRDGRARRGSADSGSSGSSSLLSSLESSTIILDVPVLHPTDAAPFDFDERCPWEYQDLAELNYSPPPAPRSKLHPQELLARARYIRYLLGLGPLPKRASRVFPDLPPPSDWDEVSVAVESESESDSDSDSDEEKSFPSMTGSRKVRFMVPAPPPSPAPEPEWEEPAWCDFM
ncbi:hypothetical protein DFH08DRAFT_1034905 [Mycena albidolilacea]|uniref:Uncharacterized protein n=1 Tax=Mycena albidolilacea TaxID=1033008 RepID=A0AAD6ZEV9_9AGAR|nr:hypothetical protein DFH08DRAFT_1034905 [Mycena albidolilacea]